jgi:hypothetical protein
MLKHSGLRAASESRPPSPPIDTNTTSGIVEAISSQRWENKMPMSSSISLPVPELKEDKIILNFFLYLFPGPLNNKKILPPFSRVQVSLYQPEDTIEFVSIEPQALNINVSPMTELGSIQKDLPYTSEEEIEKRVNEYLQKESIFHNAVDHLIKIYPKSIATLAEEEKLSIKTYRDYFYNKDEVEFLLPAYQALNPHFFTWIDSAILKN